VGMDGKSIGPRNNYWSDVFSVLMEGVLFPLISIL
jgi:hypothetical protein